MAVRISFLSCFAPEKAKDACKIMSLEEHGVKYVMEFNPPVDCVAYTVDGNIIKVQRRINAINSFLLSR